MIYAIALYRPDTVAALRSYADQKIETGGFLRAVLENNLTEACKRADLFHQDLLFAVVFYIWNELPAECWGSPQKVAKWFGEPYSCYASDEIRDGNGRTL